MRQIVTDIKMQAGEEEKAARRGELSPGLQMLSAATVETLLKYGPAVALKHS